MDEPSVAIVGGGLAGLTAAVELAERGHAVTVYEAAPQVGGQVRSVHHNGFTLDRGFQVLFAAYPTVGQVLDLSALRLRRFRPGAVLARAGMRSVLADPFRDPRAALASLSCPEVTLGDKLRTLLLRRRLRRRPFETIFGGTDRSIAAELRRLGFSDGYIEHFARPFFGAITQDPQLGSSKQLFEYIFKALTMGPIAVPSAGMGAISEQVAGRARTAGATIHTDRRVRELVPGGDHAVLMTDAEQQRVDAAIVATDPRRPHHCSRRPRCPLRHARRSPNTMLCPQMASRRQRAGLSWT
jgi:UDP-galactopyranose mutase (EC 5.4.99.9)